MSDLAAKIADLEARAEASALLSRFASDAETRDYNSSLTARLVEQANKLRAQLERDHTMELSQSP